MHESIEVWERLSHSLRKAFMHDECPLIWMAFLSDDISAARSWMMYIHCTCNTVSMSQPLLWNLAWCRSIIDESNSAIRIVYYPPVKHSTVAYKASGRLFKYWKTRRCHTWLRMTFADQHICAGHPSDGQRDAGVARFYDKGECANELIEGYYWNWCQGRIQRSTRRPYHGWIYKKLGILSRRFKVECRSWGQIDDIYI